MEANTVAQMSPGEFRAMLKEVIDASVEQKLIELLGDPDEGLQVRKAVRDRLLRQKTEVAKGEYGRSLDEVVQELGLE